MCVSQNINLEQSFKTASLLHPCNDNFCSSYVCLASCTKNDVFFSAASCENKTSFLVQLEIIWPFFLTALVIADYSLLDRLSII